MPKCKCNSCNRSAKEGLDGYCLCHNPKRQRETREKNKDRFKGYLLKRDYGISLQLYQKILVEQLGLCAVCGVESGSERNNNNGYKSLSVDHDHKTGAIRGLLCARCNQGIGSLLDDPVLLRRAADYLEKWRNSPRTTEVVTEGKELLKKLLADLKVER